MSVVDTLVSLSRALGEPSHDLAILAEGNASAKDGESFWVKASGFQMATLDRDGLVQVDLPRTMRLLDGHDLTDQDTRLALKDVRIDRESDRLPSVETFMHAYLLSLTDVSFVGHTHPTPLLSLLATQRAEWIAGKRLFPDEIVCCGPQTAFVPYVDPGLPLAKAIRASVDRYIRRWEETPKTIWLQNHGLIALGKSPREVESATQMSVKAARVWLGALSSGQEIHPLAEEQIKRIHTRPDEHYRQRLLWQMQGPTE
ncbi:MAG: class II aldolase [Fimbriimonadaceae bacterium]|nr:class II aldolase [Fimbriimonadaceae bacterium]